MFNLRFIFVCNIGLLNKSTIDSKSWASYIARHLRSLSRFSCGQHSSRLSSLISLAAQLQATLKSPVIPALSHGSDEGNTQVACHPCSLSRLSCWQLKSPVIRCGQHYSRNATNKKCICVSKIIIYKLIVISYHM